jgi:hypothetical protein
VGQALAACQGYAVSQGQPTTYCSDGWACPGNNYLDSVCYSTDGTNCSTFCWYYSSPQMGWVTACGNCTAKVYSWN